MLTDAAQAWLTDRGLTLETAERFGLESRRPKGVSGGEWIAIPYKRDGRTINHKYRRIDGEKDHRMDQDAEKPFWNFDAITNPKLQDQPLVIAEGEWDALALAQAGVERVVSVPNGAPQKSQAQSETFYSFVHEALDFLSGQQITFAGDTDANGVVLRQDFLELFGAFRCRVATWGVCKDANEYLIRFGASRLLARVKNAEWAPITSLTRMSDYPTVGDDDVTVWRSNMSPVVREKVRIISRQMTICTGIPGHGKSTFINHLTWGLCADYNIRMGVMTAEAEPNRDYRHDLIGWVAGKPRKLGWSDADMARADAFAESHIRFFDPSPPAGKRETPTLDWILELATAAVIRDQCRIIVIDPWGKIRHQRPPGQDEHEYIAESLARIEQWVRKYDAHVIIVAHPRKLEYEQPKKGERRRYKIPGPYEISGAAAWFNSAYLGITVARDPDLDAPEGDELRFRSKIITWKTKPHRLAGPPCEDGFPLYWSPAEMRYYGK